MDCLSWTAWDQALLAGGNKTNHTLRIPTISTSINHCDTLKRYTCVDFCPELEIPP